MTVSTEQLRAMQSQFRVYDGIITARYINAAPQAPGTPIEDNGDNVFYDAIPVNTSDIFMLTRVQPRRNRAGVRVWLARVNDPCKIHVIRGVRFIFPYTEEPATRQVCR